MTEFVECQACGRRFHAENLDCPYCGGGGDADAEALVEGLLRSVAPGNLAAMPVQAPRSRIFAVLFHGFAAAAAALGVAALAAWPQARDGAGRTLLAVEAGFAAVTLAGVLQRRRWGRWSAIAFIVWNAAQAVWSVAHSAPGSGLGWGPIPGAVLLFLWPFLTVHAGERFSR